MKKTFIAAFMLFTIQGFSQFKKATLTASGLTCSMCSKAIHNALSKIDFISKVEVNIKTSAYIIEFRNDANVQFDALRKAVEDAGFSIAKLQVLADFNGQAVKNDEHLKMQGQNLHFVNVSTQNLQGEKLLTLIDKNFVPVKEHKKYSQYTKMKCYYSGMMESCCPKDVKTSERIYHVTI